MQRRRLGRVCGRTRTRWQGRANTFPTSSTSPCHSSQHIANELYNFLNEYRYFKCSLEHTNTPGSLQTFPVLVLTGACSLRASVGDAKFSGQKVPVSVRVTLPVAFPTVAPEVILPYPSNPALKIQPHDYLIVNQLRIPYLTGWNIASMPMPTIVPLFTHSSA